MRSAPPLSLTPSGLVRSSAVSALAAALLGLFAGACGKPTGQEPALPVTRFAVLHKGESGWVFVKDGKPFVSLAVSVVAPKEGAPRDPKKAYDGLGPFGGNRTAWAAATAERLRGWGFNSVGAWSDEAINRAGLPYARVLWLGGQSGHGQRPDMRLVDVWDPAFEERVARQAREEAAPYAEDTNLIGFFINNELPFYGEFGWPTDPDKSLWDRYMALPPGAPGRERAAAFFRERYGGIENARKDWEAGSFEEVARGRPPLPKSLGAQRFKHEWAGQVAERYFEICAREVRRNAPNHLILGCRYAGRPPAAVVRAEAKHTDVVSINHYRADGHPDLPMLRSLHALSGKPVLITEFSWRAAENRSGNANSKGAEVTVPAQADRARAYAAYVSEWMREPYALGAHWFQYHDQPSDGRSFDGENSNYGIVDIHDRPYEELVEAMRRTNRAVIEGLASRRLPAEGYVFDPQAWSELVPVKLGGGPLSSPVVLDLHAAAASARVKADTGNSGAVVFENGLRVSYTSGPGWGLHADFSLPEMTAGARTAFIRIRGTAGHRARVFLTETGDGPPGQQAYSGRNGADGESFEYAPFTMTGAAQEILLPLGDGSIRQYWGNQRGDRTVATGGLGTLSVFVFPHQGAGEVTVESVEFRP